MRANHVGLGSGARIGFIVLQIILLSACEEITVRVEKNRAIVVTGPSPSQTTTVQVSGLPSLLPTAIPTPTIHPFDPSPSPTFSGGIEEWMLFSSLCRPFFPEAGCFAWEKIGDYCCHESIKHLIQSNSNSNRLPGTQVPLALLEQGQCVLHNHYKAGAAADADRNTCCTAEFPRNLGVLDEITTLQHGLKKSWFCCKAGPQTPSGIQCAPNTPPASPTPKPTYTGGQGRWIAVNSKDPDHPIEQARQSCWTPARSPKGNLYARMAGRNSYYEFNDPIEYSCCAGVQYGNIPCALSDYCWKKISNSYDVDVLYAVPTGGSCVPQPDHNDQSCPTGKVFMNAYHPNGAPACCSPNSSWLALEKRCKAEPVVVGQVSCTTPGIKGMSNPFYSNTRYPQSCKASCSDPNATIQLKTEKVQGGIDPQYNAKNRGVCHAGDMYLDHALDFYIGQQLNHRDRVCLGAFGCEDYSLFVRQQEGIWKGIECVFDCVLNP